jgi:hypothetical protein
MRHSLFLNLLILLFCCRYGVGTIAAYVNLALVVE